MTIKSQYQHAIAEVAIRGVENAEKTKTLLHIETEFSKVVDTIEKYMADRKKALIHITLVEDRSDAMKHIRRYVEEMNEVFMYTLNESSETNGYIKKYIMREGKRALNAAKKNNQGKTLGAINNYIDETRMVLLYTAVRHPESRKIIRKRIEESMRRRNAENMLRKESS